MRERFIVVSLMAILLALLIPIVPLAADQKTQDSKESAATDKSKLGDVEYWNKIAQQRSQQNSETKTAINLWLQKFSDLKSGKFTQPAPKALEVKQPLAPNSIVNVVSVGSGTDKTSSTVSADELFGGEYHAGWTEALFPGPGAPSAVGVSWSGGFGFPGTWVPPVSGPILPPPGPVFSSRHPSLGSHPLGGHIIAHQSHGLGSPEFLGGSAIFTDANFGGGGPWGTFAGTPVALTFFFGGVAGYLDYPNCILDDWAGNPGPPGFGAAYFTYTGFIDGDGDPNFDGNPFNDPADVSLIFFNYSNTLAPPFVYPVISPPIPVNVAGAPTLALQSDLAVVSPSGAGPLPPGALCVAWTDGYIVGGPPAVGPPPEGMMFLPTSVWYDVSPAPGAGAPFGFFGGNVFISPIFFPIGPLIGGGTQAMSTVTVAKNNATYPNPCGPGAVYVAWSDAAFGDPDILFSASFAGGAPGTWTPPVRVNQDPLGPPMRDQWAPAMAVDSLGNINIIFYDRRMDPAFNTATAVWMASSFDCGATWTDALFSVPPPLPVPNPPATTIPPGYIGDYVDLDENALNGAGGIWNDSRPTLGSQDVWFEYTKPTCTAKAGDADTSTTYTLSDVIRTVNYIFSKPGFPACPSSSTLCWLSNLLCRGDWNFSGTVTLGDVIRAVNYIFNKPGGPWLAVPIGQCCAPVP